MRRSAPPAAADGRSVSDDLDAVDRATRQASAPLTPSLMGADTQAPAERVARFCRCRDETLLRDDDRGGLVRVERAVIVVRADGVKHYAVAIVAVGAGR